MDTLTELVEKKRLFHRFQHPYTIHVSLDLSHDGEHQPEVQKWRREQGIGAGGGGKVFLEVFEIQPSEAGQPAEYKFRAVKEIARRGVTDQTYKRELKAIFNFSQKKVWMLSTFSAMAACANGAFLTLLVQRFVRRVIWLVPHRRYRLHCHGVLQKRRPRAALAALGQTTPCFRGTADCRSDFGGTLFHAFRGVYTQRLEASGK